MDAPDRLQQLRSLRESIAALSVATCRMAHERVVRSVESGLPMTNRVPEGSYRRIGLCAPALRALRLGCSHTMARVRLQDAIGALASDADERGALGDELAALENAIHLLDHRKGEAEKALADALQAFNRTPADRLSVLDSEVGQLEDLHDEYVDRLARLRDRVLSEIDAAIAHHRGD
jgi:hypothetical protein